MVGSAILFIGYFFSVFSPAAFSEVMFEGYYKVSVSDKHVGYTVQRYEFDTQKKQFKSVYFIQTNKEAGGINESLVAVANDKFEPISYQYTAKVGNSIKLIDAKFNKGVMTATIGSGTHSQKVQKKLEKGTFLSSFLGYLMLQQGYEVGKKYSYKAIAEEDAEVFKGEALIKEKTKYKNFDTFRILNEFKDAQFVSYVNERGDVLGTNSPVQKISTDLTATPVEATQGLVMPSQTLKTLFKSVPRGNINPLVKQETKEAPPSVEIKKSLEPTKKEKTSKDAQEIKTQPTPKKEKLSH